MYIKYWNFEVDIAEADFFSSPPPIRTCDPLTSLNQPPTAGQAAPKDTTSYAAGRHSPSLLMQPPIHYTTHFSFCSTKIHILKFQVII